MCLLACARAAAGQTARNGAVDHQDSRRCVMHVGSDTLARWRVDSADMSTARSLHQTCSMCPPVAAQAAAVCRACTAAADRDRRSNLRKTTRLGSGHHHRRHLLKRPTSQAPERKSAHSLRPPHMTAPSRPAPSHPTMVATLASHREASRWLPRGKCLSYVRRPRWHLACRYPFRRRHAATFSGADYGPASSHIPVTPTWTPATELTGPTSSAVRTINVIAPGQTA